MTILARALLAGAALLTGFLAGGDLDRALVAMPAWQRVGAVGWAAFSRHADLANGLFLYPAEAIGGTLLTLGAIASLHSARIGRPTALLFLYASFVLSIGGLLFTIKAAPIMLSISNVSDSAALQHAFEGFSYWGNLRGVCQIAAFAGLVCALVMYPSSQQSQH